MKEAIRKNEQISRNIYNALATEEGDVTKRGYVKLRGELRVDLKKA